MKKQFQNILMFLGGVFILAFLLILAILIFPAKYSLEFYLEDNSTIDGFVYFEKEFIGTTNNGLIKISENKIGPGELAFVGIDKEGKEYTIYFDMIEEDYLSYYISFIITNEDITYSQLDLSQINETILRDKIFNLINKKRDEYQIQEVRRNILLDKVAQDYAEEMIITELFAHEPYEGYGPGERLQKKDIFYLSFSEVLSQTYFYQEEEFVSDVVEGWIKSPSHRSTILDSGKPIYWESLGIGVSCEENEEGIVCYVVGLFGRLESFFSDELRRDYYIPYELYSEGLGFSSPVNAKIIFNSSEKMDILLLKSIEDYEQLLKGNSYDEIFHKKGINFYEEEIELIEGYILVPHASVKDSDYNLTIIYNY